MWQRKQTIFLVLALVALLLAAFFPLYGMIPEGGMGEEKLLFAIGFKGGDSVVSWLSANLLLLVVDFVLSLVAIVQFKNRKSQMKLISSAELVSVLWYVFVAIEVYLNYSQPQFKLGIVFPLIALILQFMALKGVKHDDELVRAADRIR